jgi:hypothetical protein
MPKGPQGQKRPADVIGQRDQDPLAGLPLGQRTCSLELMSTEQARVIEAPESYQVLRSRNNNHLS